MNVADPILFHCKMQPSAPALFLPGENVAPVTYQQLGRYIENVGRRARTLELRKGSFVLLSIQDQVLSIVTLIALTKLGVVTFSTQERLDPDIRIDAILTDSPALSEQNPSAHLVDKSWLLGVGVSPFDETIDQTSQTDACRIFFTSGTTGYPKAVLLTHAQIFSRLSQRDTVFGARFANCSRVFIGLGFSTFPGYVALIHILSRGGALLLQTDNPLQTLRAISDNQIQAVLAAPQTLAAMVDFYKKRPGVFRKVDVIIPFGSSVSAELVKTLQDLFCHELMSVYGSTELASVAVARMEVLKGIDGAVGYVAPGVSVDIVGENNQILSFGEIGRVRIRSPFAAQGYLRGDINNVEGFPNEGIIPGDLGSLSPDGLLVIMGRENSVINLGGNKLNPERVEAAITSFPQVRDAAISTFKNLMGIDQLVGVIVWSDNFNLDDLRKGLRSHLEKRISVGQIPRIFIEMPEIPRNDMGKIDRSELRIRALAMIKIMEEKRTSAGD
jgi:acyl-coenzyme A synthetase/AMP-(fatty) acid ligase